MTAPAVTVAAADSPPPPGASDQQLVVTPFGLAYAHPRSGDRDAQSVLWHRAPAPEWAEMPPGQQYRCMEQLLCQNCARPAYTAQAGTLFLLRDRVRWPEGMLHHQPPACLPCAGQAVRQEMVLPSSRQRAVLVHRSVVYGVRGQMYGPPEPGVSVPEGPVTLPYGSRTLPWMLATQLVRRLHGVTPVTLSRRGAA